MSLNGRKLAIGLVALGILFLVYLAYTRWGGIARIDLGVGEPFPNALPADSASLFDGNTPRIGGAQVGAVEQTEFIHTREGGGVDRKFGFDTLLHKEGDQWKITKPYYSLFMPQFRCDITADQGQVQCETAFGRPVPDNAMFSGNVVIHIVPNDPNDPKEVFIYLDDVAFIAERSLFSTIGSVKFVSRSAQLVGRGMELVYDEGRNRLELFRINDLESLRLRSAEIGSLSNVTGRGKTPSAESAPPADANAVALDAGGAPIDGAAPYYECVFWKNVRIETPEQIVVARQRLAINNILWSDDNAAPLDETPAAAAPVAEPNEPEVVPYPGPKALDTKPSRFLAFSSLSESSFDIIVTCDGGFVVGPKGIGTDAPEPNDLTAVAEGPAPAAVDPNHQTVRAERIDVDAVTSDVALAGPVQIDFTLDPNDLTARDAQGELMPVTITAQEAVTFLAATDQIRLDGDCVVTLRQAAETQDVAFLSYKYALAAPRLTLDLVEDPNATEGQITLRHMTAEGGPVSVRGLRYACDELVGWVKLDGSRLDYDVVGKNFLVTGPGTISIHNAEAVEAGPEVDPNAFSLRQPCYALMSNFDRLTYSASTQRIVAESAGRIQLGYIPILADGAYGPAVNADAGHIEVLLKQTPDGQTELATLTASRGITYEDETQDFAGSTLIYDHARGLVRVTGDADQPCYFNGALVNEIEMDVSTRNVKMQFQAPSTLQVR